jgi:nitroimidazol reductase NimA-like FMN-containing flavoprotein (pyridoxamine 5'-phosphate oxidase superfamily)
MNKELAEKARQVISKISYITIATVSKDSQPWNAPVFSAYDEAYNFYWGSHVGSQHSLNIAANPNVFLVIYDSTVAAGSGAGVYVKAKAVELTDMQEIRKAHKLLWDRHVVPFWKIEQVYGDAPIRLYKASPEKFWMNGEGEVKGNYIDTRVEVNSIRE